MRTQNYIFFFQNKCNSSVKKSKYSIFFFTIFFQVVIAFILKRQNIVQSLHYFRYAKRQTFYTNKFGAKIILPEKVRKLWPNDQKKCKLGHKVT